MSQHDRLRELISHRAHPSVTITLPTAVRGPETREGPIRLKNLAKEAATVLDAEVDAEREILEWLDGLVEDDDFWQHQREGLMLLASPGIREERRMPTTLPESVSVEWRFHLKHAIRMANSPVLEVLAFSRGHVRLLRCDASHVDVIEVPGLTESMDEFVQFDDLEVHDGARSADSRHKEDLDRFAKAVAKRMDQRRASMISPPPLLLAAATREAAAYRAASRDPLLDEKTIEGSHDRTDNETLRTAAWEFAAEARRLRQGAARDRVVQAVASDKGSTSLTRVLAAAHSGLVETIFAALDVEKPGHFNVAEGAVLRTGVGTPERGDLVDEAACTALLYGADVYVVPKENMPVGEEVAARFRG